ncbi:tyrosine-type recombinase/integrase [Pseudaminobacter sp. NGMCC 1.201702]|uniref:tyrosine-type recombinase/integrase n=1 Tax=Pseudaminobacter sp. NGMCC 1.201702 TaxID=3391825 RepID=UPI0039F0EB87
MKVRLKGINTVKAKLADGKTSTYYYHRASGKRLAGKPGTATFIASIAEAEQSMAKRGTGTLAGIIRDFQQTAKWRKLAPSTQKEYARVFTFWEDKFGTLPKRGLSQKTFRRDVISWHDEFSADKPREADNRVTVLARVLSWAAKDSDLEKNVLDGFERAYTSDRSDKIWLPEHVDAFMAVADSEMQLAMVLALHTGQRQADIRKLAWSQYDGQTITLRQGKTGAHVRVPCTQALKATLDAIPRRGALILLTKTDKAFQKRYFAECWDKAAKLAAEKRPDIADLHFHDIRGTTVTMLFEAGCTVAEVASITGHTLRRAQEILDRYLSRTSTMATNAIAKFESTLAAQKQS